MRQPKPLPDRQFVDESLAYDPKTGKFRWRRRPLHHFPNQRICNICNTRDAGKVAGNVSNGYIYIRLRNNGGKLFPAHRLAWLLTHGEPIPAEIDHINGNRSDNRIANLRAATRGENAANNRTRTDSAVGLKGVTRHPNGRFRVKVGAHKQQHHIGYFATLEEAVAARREAAERLHGEFARHD